jgi:hypothetical protein
MKHLKAFENYSGINEEFKEIDREAFDYIINREAPSEFIKYVYDNTNVKDHGTLEEYIEWVDSKYKNYFITHHYSKSDDILHSVIKTPEQRGGSYNSADGFFVSPKLRIEEHKMNFFVMIPKNLNFLLTDYNFSNILDFYKDFSDDHGLILMRPFQSLDTCHRQKVQNETILNLHSGRVGIY